MSGQISLRDAEQKAFRMKYDDGLWDVMLGSVLLQFPIAIHLSPSLGDFWSSVAMLPFWALVWLAVWLVRKYVINPRIGAMRPGAVRRAKLARLTLLMLIANAVALVLGIVAAFTVGRVSGQVIGILFGMMLLVGFSAAGYFLGIRRLYAYGLLVGLCPPVGEWLWTKGLAAHHGFPITFGTAAGVIILVGLGILIRLLLSSPAHRDGLPSSEA